MERFVCAPFLCFTNFIILLQERHAQCMNQKREGADVKCFSYVCFYYYFLLYDTAVYLFEKMKNQMKTRKKRLRLYITRMASLIKLTGT